MNLHPPSNTELAARLDELLTLIRETRESVNTHNAIFKEHQKALEEIAKRLEGHPSP